MVLIVRNVVIGFQVDKRTLIAQIPDIGYRGGDAGAKARKDGDRVVGGFGHCGTGRQLAIAHKCSYKYSRGQVG